MSEPLSPPSGRWYVGITRYQWVVLIIASLGWVFDVFEGQIFVASMEDAMPTFIPTHDADGHVLSEEHRAGIKGFYNNVALAAFLLGGALGGIVFGALSDRIGRKRTMTYTILFYSAFTFLSAFSMDWWHLAAFRFLVAMGVGGEWAVASTLVYEVFPARARAHVGGIFHASSVLGTYLAVLAGVLVLSNPAVDAWVATTGIPSLKWRMAFALGVIPAFLIVWIRRSLKEPESWLRVREAASTTRDVGRVSELLTPTHFRSTLVGLLLAAIGMGTFWGVHVHGRMLPRNETQRRLIAEQETREGTLDEAGRQEFLKRDEINRQLKRSEMWGMLTATTGGGLGLLSFGPICHWLGRRPAFAIFHVLGLVFGWLTFSVPVTGAPMWGLLLVFGFFTLGMHAGYAIYFPDLFPTRLRGTGAGLCFNGGRFLAAPILLLSGWMVRDARFGLHDACRWLSLLYLLGLIVLVFAPDRGQQAPESTVS